MSEATKAKQEATESRSIQLPNTPNPSYLEIARNCSCLVNVASQMAADWVTAGKPEKQHFNWTPRDTCPSTSDLFSRFTFSEPLIWSTFIYGFPNKTATEPFGFMASDGTRDYLIFRGTLFDQGKKSPDFIADEDIHQIPYDKNDPNKGKVSQGFYRVWQGIFNQTDSSSDSLPGLLQKSKDNDLPLAISGHSLGSTLATFAVLWHLDNAPGISLTAYPQASPKVGDPKFAEYYDKYCTERGAKTYRLVNTVDSVPKSPPGDYAHVGLAVEFKAEYTKVNEKGETVKDEAKIHNPCCSYAYALEQVGTTPYDPVNPDNVSGKCDFPTK